jgi:hypothetical protein
MALGGITSVCTCLGASRRAGETQCVRQQQSDYPLPSPVLTTQQQSPPATRTRDHTNRILGIVGLLSSPAFLVAWLMGGFGNPEPAGSVVLAQLLFLVGWICSIVALIRRGAAGAGPSRYLLWIQLGGVSLAATQELQDLLLARTGRTDILYQVADAAWPLSVLFMIATGIAVARAGVIKGWLRFSAVSCGLALPVAIAAAALLGRAAMGAAFALLTTVAWGVLAWAVVSNAGNTREDMVAPDTSTGRPLANHSDCGSRC